jgi:hypothetical protein
MANALPIKETIYSAKPLGPCNITQTASDLAGYLLDTGMHALFSSIYIESHHEGLWMLRVNLAAR